jgi:hypothetical protein
VVEPVRHLVVLAERPLRAQVPRAGAEHAARVGVRLLAVLEHDVHDAEHEDERHQHEVREAEKHKHAPQLLRVRRRVAVVHVAHAPALVEEHPLQRLAHVELDHLSRVRVSACAWAARARARTDVNMGRELSGHGIVGRSRSVFTRPIM